MTRPAVPDTALDQLFRAARTYPRFLPVDVSDTQIHALHDLLRWGPTAFNSQPARFVFVRSAAAREKLATCVSGSNRAKVLSAGVSVVVAYDTGFVKDLPRFTANPSAQALFQQLPAIVEPTALRSGSLQAAYLVLAARALGLDAGVLTGFDADALRRSFFPAGGWSANLVANLGTGDPSALAPRAERYRFDEVAAIL